MLQTPENVQWEKQKRRHDRIIKNLKELLEKVRTGGEWSDEDQKKANEAKGRGFTHSEKVFASYVQRNGRVRLLAAEVTRRKGLLGTTKWMTILLPLFRFFEITLLEYLVRAEKNPGLFPGDHLEGEFKVGHVGMAIRMTNTAVLAGTHRHKRRWPKRLQTAPKLLTVSFVEGQTSVPAMQVLRAFLNMTLVCVWTCDRWTAERQAVWDKSAQLLEDPDKKFPRFGKPVVLLVGQFAKEIRADEDLTNVIDDIVIRGFGREKEKPLFSKGHVPKDDSFILAPETRFVGPKGGTGDLPTLYVTYVPETQRSVVLRVRKRLNREFNLHFVPVSGRGQNGDGDDEETRSLLEAIPADIVFIITTLLATDPTPSGAKTLFNLAATSKGARAFLEDWPGHLEKTASKILLGVFHSRTREERRVGLASDVAERYQWVLRYISRSAKPLQERSIKNLALYQEYGAVAYEGDKGKELDPMINPWPWWYLRLLSNWKTKKLVGTETKKKQMDNFAASIVRISGGIKTRLDTGAFKRLHLTKTVGRRRQFRKKAFQMGSSGAVLVVIPLDVIYQRALSYYQTLMAAGESPTKIRILVHLDDVFVPSDSADEHEPDPFDPTAFQKEVEILGGDSLFDEPLQLEESTAPSHIRLDLFIRGAFVSSRSQFMRFLQTFHLQDFLQKSSLALQYIHFQGIGQSLDLRKASARENPPLLRNLYFGPANTPLAPLLSCPSPGLQFLRLAAPLGRSMELHLATTTSNICFPNLFFFAIKRNVLIWEPSILKTIGSSSILSSVRLEKFSGSSEQLRKLMNILGKISRESDEGMSVVYSYADKGRSLYRDLGSTIYNRLQDEDKMVFMKHDI